MAPLFVTADLVIFGLAMFNLGLVVPLARHRWFRWRAKRRRSGRAPIGAVTRDDIRAELCRDPVAVEMFMDDHTPEDVQRYLYLEAERRAFMRKRRELTDSENDFFAPPRRPSAP